jgi:uncharacterized protein
MSITEKVVIDTNVFITIFKKDGENRWMFDKILNGEWILCLNNEIFMEYWELLEDKMTVQIASNIIDFLISHPHILFIENFIRLNLISVDPDDNKFCDCCFSASANFIVSNDKHFDILQDIEFPKIIRYKTFQIRKFYL